MTLIARRFNAVISFIILSDFVLTASASLISPLFALFVTNQIVGGTAKVVGFSMAIYWISKSLLQLPVAKFLDRNHGEIDDYYFMLSGILLGSVVIGSYYFANQSWHIYLLQGLFGVADALLVPPFYAIFTRHIDKGSEGFEWSLRSSFSFGGGAALGGALSGILLALVGFKNIFLLASVFYAISALILLLLKPYIQPKVPKTVRRDLVEHKRI